MTAEEVIKELQKYPPQATVASFNPTVNEFYVITGFKFVVDEDEDTGYIQFYIQAK